MGTGLKNLLKEYSLMEEEEDFHDQAKKRNYSTSVINDYLPEADFPTSSLQIIHDEEESEVFNIKQGNQLNLRISISRICLQMSMQLMN